MSTIGLLVMTAKTIIRSNLSEKASRVIKKWNQVYKAQTLLRVFFLPLRISVKYRFLLGLSLYNIQWL